MYSISKISIGSNFLLSCAFSEIEKNISGINFKKDFLILVSILFTIIKLFS